MMSHIPTQSSLYNRVQNASAGMYLLCHILSCLLSWLPQPFHKHGLAREHRLKWSATALPWRAAANCQLHASAAALPGQIRHVGYSRLHLYCHSVGSILVCNLLLIWQFLRCSSQLDLPTLQEYSNSGHFKVRDRMWSAVKSNLYFYLVVTVSPLCCTPLQDCQRQFIWGCTWQS